MTEANEPSDRREFLDLHEVRVLAVLAEKEAVTPDIYPLSLNALVSGCNQLTNRDPVMALDEAAVQEVLERLIEKRLVAEVRQAGGRVAKYEHRMRIKWVLEQDKLALLVMLMLRGEQTAGELRARSARLHEFSSSAELEAGLQFLMDKYPPLVARLPKAPGTKEARYAQLLSGDSPLREAEGEVRDLPKADRISALESEVAALRAEVGRLAGELAEFRKQFD
ncbi:MAG TPA: YceH family protein [Noviherbaspirillum sp.]